MKYIHSHWQNLNECRKCGEVCGPAWSGRAWRFIYPDTDERGEPRGNPKTWHIEWDFFNRRRQVRISLAFWGGDNSDEILFGISVPFLFSLWFGVEGYLKSEWRKGEREIACRLDMQGDCGEWGTFSLDLWRNPNEWSRSDAWWRHIYWDIADKLLGSTNYQSDVVAEHKATVTFPEGSYPVVIKQNVATWTRPPIFGIRLRFGPWFRKRVGFEVVPETPVPIPGKGENSWDCDEDAVYSMGIGAKSTEEACDRFVASIDSSRRRHGGEGWLPRKKAEHL